MLPIIVWIAISITSCKKLVEVVPPITSASSAIAYNTDASAISAVTGLYTNLSTGVVTGNRGISFLCGLSADEFTQYSGVASSTATTYYYLNQLVASPSTIGADFWGIYQYIYVCNSAIEGLTAATSLTPAIKQQLLGETRFMRGFYYFYLVNFFGDVPLITSSDYRINVGIARTPKAQVWDQIISDLQAARDLLSINYLDGTLVKTTTERVRPTQGAASALLSRVYLYTGVYAKAEEQASAVINNSSLYGLVPFINTSTTPATQNDVFLKNSSEAIWQIQTTIAGHNTEEANMYLLPTTGPNSNPNTVYLSPQLLASFEAGDQRRFGRNWIDSIKIGSITYFFPCKYRANNYQAVNGVFATPTEYLTALRLGEQYLIRAEARAQQGNISGAQADLNIIRTRAGLPNTTAASQSALLTTVLHERQVELFTEWGHRWLDLKRTGQVDAVMGGPSGACAVKGGTWSSYQQLYPIPAQDISYAPNLTQNLGY